MRLLPIMLLMILLLPSAYSLTAAIGNARVVLNVEGSPENPAIVDRTLKVINKNDIAVNVHFNPSIELRPFINIIDNDFTLQPGEEKDAAFVLTIDRGGNFVGAINVLFSPADPEVKDNDVGLASKIIINSVGPIIEDPNQPSEETEATEETDTESETEEESETESEINATSPSNSETETDNKPTTPIIKKNDGGANPFIGIGILAVVLVIGVGAYFAFAKMKTPASRKRKK